MTGADIKKFTIWMGLLGTAFGGKGLTKAQMDVYFDFLADLDVDVFGEAVERIIKTRKYQSIPTVAEIREAALGGDGQAEDDARIMWSRAEWLMDTGRRPEKGRDDILVEVVNAAFGSWQMFGNGDPEMSAADRNHFIKCYLAVVRKRRERLALNGGVEIKRLTGGIA